MLSNDLDAIPQGDCAVGKPALGILGKTDFPNPRITREFRKAPEEVAGLPEGEKLSKATAAVARRVRRPSH
jgi:hypothetical protein